MNVVEGTTMIGKSVKIVGDLSGSEDLTMDGELQGTIQLAGARLTIGQAARIRGDIAAKDVVVFGRLDGDVRATGRVELRATAVVQGNIYAGSFSIEDNAAFRGQVDPSRAQEPMPEKSTSPARQMPAALAAVVASLNVQADTAGGGSEDAHSPTPLFAETEA